MKNTNANIRIAGFTLAVILGMVGLGFVPPFKMFGMEFESVDILSTLRAEDSMAEAMEDHTADFDLLGLVAGTEYVARELWTNQEDVVDGSFDEVVRRGDAAIYKIYPKPDDTGVEGMALDRPHCYYDAYAQEVCAKGNALILQSRVYNLSGTCVLEVQSVHEAVSVKHLPSGTYLYQGVDNHGNNLVCKFKK